MDDPPPTVAAAAGLGRRLGSLCYEALLLSAILFLGGWAFLAVNRLFDPALSRPLFQLYLLAITAVYFIYCWARGGQTLPMKTWRIRLTTRGGGAITLRMGAKRYLFALASVALCGFGFVWALLDRDRQFLHDRLAGTRLIFVPPTTSSPPPGSKTSSSAGAHSIMAASRATARDK